jgi:hypothetical protein
MRVTKSLLLISLMLAAATADAGRFPESALFMLGYSEVTPGDLTAMPHWRTRRRDESGFYASVSGDLSGDRRIDEVRLLRNDKEKTVSVVATIRSREQLDTYFLKTVPLARLDRLGIRAEHSGDMAITKPVGHPGTGLVVFDLRTMRGDLYRFDGLRFERSPIAAAPASSGGRRRSRRR